MTTPDPFNGSWVLSTAQTARRASTANVATSETMNCRAAGSVIQRGMLRSMPSGPRTVMAMWAWRETRTTSSWAPASGWNGYWTVTLDDWVL